MKSSEATWLDYLRAEVAATARHEELYRTIITGWIISGPRLVQIRGVLSEMYV